MATFRNCFARKFRLALGFIKTGAHDTDGTFFTVPARWDVEAG